MKKKTALNIPLALFAAFVMTIEMFIGGFALTARAAEDYDPRDTNETKASVYYTVSGLYDIDMEMYIVNVYLSSDYPIMTGAFGLSWDRAIKPEWNGYDSDIGSAGFFTYNDTYVSMMYEDLFLEAEDILEEENYSFFAYEMNEPMLPEHMLLLSMFIPDTQVDANGNPIGWSETPFKTLDWNECLFAGVEVELGASSWRDATMEEIEMIVPSPDGFYQVYIMNNNMMPQAVDAPMAFNIKTGLEPIVVKGTVSGYNPNREPIVTAHAVDKNGEWTAIAADIWYEGDEPDRHGVAWGPFKWGYEITLPYRGDWLIQLDKFSHVVCQRTVYIDSLTSTYEMPNILLFPGDINGDGYIKDNDRATGFAQMISWAVVKRDMVADYVKKHIDKDADDTTIAYYELLWDKYDLDGTGGLYWSDELLWHYYCNYDWTDYHSVDYEALLPQPGGRGWWAGGYLYGNGVMNTDYYRNVIKPRETDSNGHQDPKNYNEYAHCPYCVPNSDLSNIYCPTYRFSERNGGSWVWAGGWIGKDNNGVYGGYGAM